jgi:hypothetical protein
MMWYHVCNHEKKIYILHKYDEQNPTYGQLLKYKSTLYDGEQLKYKSTLYHDQQLIQINTLPWTKLFF